MQTLNPKIDPDSSAAKVAAKFDKNGRPRAAALAKAIGRTPSTVQRWLEKGHIDGQYHADIVDASRRLSIAEPVKPEDFVDARAFAKVE